MYNHKKDLGLKSRVDNTNNFYQAIGNFLHGANVGWTFKKLRRAKTINSAMEKGTQRDHLRNDMNDAGVMETLEKYEQHGTRGDFVFVNMALKRHGVEDPETVAKREERGYDNHVLVQMNPYLELENIKWNQDLLFGGPIVCERYTHPFLRSHLLPERRMLSSIAGGLIAREIKNFMNKDDTGKDSEPVIGLIEIKDSLYSRMSNLVKHNPEKKEDSKNPAGAA